MKIKNKIKKKIQGGLGRVGGGQVGWGQGRCQRKERLL